MNDIEIVREKIDRTQTEMRQVVSGAWNNFERSMKYYKELEIRLDELNIVLSHLEGGKNLDHDI